MACRSPIELGLMGTVKDEPNTPPIALILNWRRLLPSRRWCDERNEIAAVTPINREVASIDGDDAAVSDEFRHWYDTAVGEVHLAFGVLLQPCQHRCRLLRQIEILRLV